MNKLLSLLVTGLVILPAASVDAADSPFFSAFRPPKFLRIEPARAPGVDGSVRFSATAFAQAPPAPAAADGSPAPKMEHKAAPAESITLYPNVRYEDVDEMHPCAVPMIVKVQDPCYQPGSCCQPGCVYIQICVPPCGCPPRIRVSRHGTKVKYDYGKYEVEIKSRRGVIEVEYDY